MSAKEVAWALFRAIENKDLDALPGLYHDDAKVWHNFDDYEESKAESIGRLTSVLNVADLKYHVREEYVAGDTLIRQHNISLTFAGGDVKIIPVAVFVKVAGDKIIRIDEYLDGASAQGG